MPDAVGPARQGFFVNYKRARVLSYCNLFYLFFSPLIFYYLYLGPIFGENFSFLPPKNAFFPKKTQKKRPPKNARNRNESASKNALAPLYYVDISNYREFANNVSERKMASQTKH